MYEEIKNVNCPYCNNITDVIKWDDRIFYKCCGIGNPDNNSYYNQIDSYKSSKKIEELKEYKHYLLHSCNLPERYINLKFSSFPNTENNPDKVKVISACKHYIDDYEGKFITFYGYPSTGKTTFATIIVKYIINRINNTKFTCKFITENELINEIVGFNQKQIYYQYLKYDLLVIDELGLITLNYNGKGNEKIFNVINDRYNKMKATILTTNIDLSKTSDVILYRIYERIYQQPNIVLFFNWQGLRLT
jgi:DNA replication protein DnaC